MKRLNIFLLAIFTTFLFACNGGGEGTDTDSTEHDMDQMDEMEEGEKEMGHQDGATMEKDGIKISAFNNFKDFSGVTLALQNQQVAAGQQTLKFSAENFKLGEQTPDFEQTGLAYSNDGQHIHVILNNEPYMAKYKPEVQVEVKPEHYALLAFPARSYHLSIKDKNAMVLKSLDKNKFDESKPHLFYSRPKGEYTGQHANKILLDFYLVNTDLSENGNYVEATIDNGTKFKITKWQPYVIEGMKMGEHTIKLELFNEDGSSVQSPLNPVSRTITLKQ